MKARIPKNLNYEPNNTQSPRKDRGIAITPSATTTATASKAFPCAVLSDEARRRLEKAMRYNIEFGDDDLSDLNAQTEPDDFTDECRCKYDFSDDALMKAVSERLGMDDVTPDLLKRWLMSRPESDTTRPTGKRRFSPKECAAVLDKMADVLTERFMEYVRGEREDMDWINKSAFVDVLIMREYTRIMAKELECEHRDDGRTLAFDKFAIVQHMREKAEFEKRLSGVADELKRLNDSLWALKDRIERKTENVRRLKLKINATRAKIDRCEDELKKSRGKAKVALENEFDALCAQLRIQEEKLDETKNKLASLENERKATEGQIESSTSEKSILSDYVDRIAAEIKRLREEIVYLTTPRFYFRKYEFGVIMATLNVEGDFGDGPMTEEDMEDCVAWADRLGEYTKKTGRVLDNFESSALNRLFALLHRLPKYEIVYGEGTEYLKGIIAEFV